MAGRPHRSQGTLIFPLYHQRDCVEQHSSQSGDNDKANFRYVFNPALDKALVDRHANHREFINELFDREDLMAFFRGKMLDEVYERLRAESARD